MTGFPALPPALRAESHGIAGPRGDLNVYVAGKGAPLLLVHSVNAAASAAEVRPLHDHFIMTRRVYSLDLPGFGFSARGDHAYTPRDMTDAVLACVQYIRSDCGDRPVDALALSLSSEYLARAAAERPDQFRSVALVSPTGFKKGAVRRAAPGATRGIPWLYRALRGPGWGGWLYRQLTRPAVIRYFLRRTWGSAAIDETLWTYDILTARVANAEFAPLRFLSGYLFSGDIHTVYDALTPPVWMSHGIRGDFTDYGDQARLAGRSNWRFTTFPTGALPHFEMTREFCAQYTDFMAAVDEREATVSATHLIPLT